MPRKIPKRPTTFLRAGLEQSAPPQQDLAGGSPEWLRDRVFNALKELSPDQRGSVRDRIISDLRKAGINVTSGLLKLGICASTPDDLSPNDVAKLVRYVRMNTPGVMNILGGTLTDLIAPESQKATVYS